MDFVTLGGNVLGTIPLGDIVLYLTPFNLFLFAVLLGFTLLIALSKPETQIEATMHYLNNTEIQLHTFHGFGRYIKHRYCISRKANQCVKLSI